ncbi:MAG: DUF58 domain-containing protein [Rubrivivax sp.]|nr:DUF58 domain-containing protein [Rubrivivax sp.]MDP3224345.1 DUF58 domain-containing protein [Rubrivivax sp.]
MTPRARFRQWWQNRLPLTDTWELGQRNIYILPTRAGFTFVGTLIVMLLAAINYQLNLGYALTFLLAGAGLVSMHLTHGNLRGLTLHLRPLSSGFAGEPVQLDVVLSNPGRERHGLALRFEDRRQFGPATAWCDAPTGGQAGAQLSFVPPHRGWHPAPALVLETLFPFGLFRAWTVWRPAGRALAWPQPEHPVPPLPHNASTAGDEHAMHRSTGSELDGVRPWRRGDTMRQVVWKKVARSGELVSRETAGTASRALWLDWSEAGVAGTEERLSRLAAWVLLADREGLDCGLRLPGRELPPQNGDAHRRAALDLLGQWS